MVSAKICLVLLLCAVVASEGASTHKARKSGNAAKRNGDDGGMHQESPKAMGEAVSRMSEPDNMARIAEAVSRMEPADQARLGVAVARISDMVQRQRK